jgi:hypothetical protein
MRKIIYVHIMLIRIPFLQLKMFVCLVVFNATFNNISVISWRSVLLVAKNCRTGENHRPVACHWQTCTPRPDRDSTHNISGDWH